MRRINLVLYSVCNANNLILLSTSINAIVFNWKTSTCIKTIVYPFMDYKDCVLKEITLQNK